MSRINKWCIINRGDLKWPPNNRGTNLFKAGDEIAFAEYSSFYIAREEDKYKIHLSGYYGTEGYPLCIKIYTLKWNSECKQIHVYNNINKELRECAKKNVSEWCSALNN